MIPTRKYDMTDSRSLLEQEKSIEPPAKKRKTEASTGVEYNSIYYNPTLADEAMPVYFPRGLPEIMLGYLGGDIHPKPKKHPPTHSYQPVKLFGKKFKEWMHPEAAKVASLVLRGLEKDVEEALALIKKNPDLLRYHAIATDPLGRRVKGTPLQIAAMAGDVDLREGIQEEKDRGMVERLIAAGNLSHEEVVEQLQVMTSEEAQQENEKRNQRILAAIIKFGESIRDVQEDKHKKMSFKKFQMACKDHINQLEKDLQAGANELITSGYVFDPRLLSKTTKWFEDNFKKFGRALTNQGKVFLINGFGKLQSRLSSRDAQVIVEGVGNLVQGYCPLRILISQNGACYFLNPTSQLGVNFYLGDYGLPHCERSQLSMGPICLESVCETKKRTLQNVCKAVQLAWGANGHPKLLIYNPRMRRDGV